jgi:hypothetical protein
MAQVTTPLTLAGIDPPYDSVNSSLSQGRKNEFVLLWFLFTFFNRLFYTENLIVLSLYL